MGGQVKAVYVKQGQHVNKGQLLLRLDDAIARQQVAAVRQQTEGIKTQLALAKNVYERQKIFGIKALVQKCSSSHPSQMWRA